MEHINPDHGCIGCSACKAVCPKNAVRMGTSSNGFYIPIVDEEMCVSCGLCKRVCPLLNSQKIRSKDETRSIYAFAKNEQERKRSCSGGFFYALAKKMLEEGGVVCGCVWDDTLKAKHICTNELAEVQRMRGSKYVQSDMGDCFSEIKDYLIAGKRVLFGGTGCQTTALKKYIGNQYGDKLITCAVVCGGIPSPLVWKYYSNALEKRVGSKIRSVEMRSKIHGWLMPEIYIKTEDGKVINEVLLQENLYGTNFGDGLFINQECMTCKFKLTSVEADLLLSDDWGIDRKRLRLSRNLGSSAVISLTEKGDKWIEKVKNALYIENGDVDSIIESHHVLMKDHGRNGRRDEFFEKVNQDNILELLQLSFDSWKKKVSMSKIAELLYRCKLYTPIYTMLWHIRHK